MIKKKTVFILGAGASMPYGYPSGFGLVDKFSSLHSDTVQVLTKLGYDQSHWGTFQKELKRSVQSSVDAFLERREDLRELGKALVASVIIQCETQGLMVSTDDPWYSMLVDKLDGPYDEIGKNPVSFVTFNYDRSLEHFLSESLCSRHKKECQDVSKQIATLPIIHIYGHVGRLKWQDPAGRDYSPVITPEIVKAAANQIRIISEGRDDSPELQEARNAISEAERVFFLGFGFHPDNMRRLGFPYKRAEKLRVVGSGFGLTHAESEYYKDTYLIDRLGGNNEKNVAFLRNCREFLSLAD